MGRVAGYLKAIQDAAPWGDIPAGPPGSASGNLPPFVSKLFSVLDSQYSYQGIYKFTYTGTVQASAQNGTSSAFFWLYNPLGSTINVAIERLQVMTQMGSGLSTPSAPPLQFRRFINRGAGNPFQGQAIIIPGKRRSSDYSPQGGIFTGILGAPAITLGPTLWTAYPLVTTGTAAWSYTLTDENDFITGNLYEWEMDVLVPGEGLLFYQNGNGTGSDTRVIAVNGSWAEWTEPI